MRNKLIYCSQMNHGFDLELRHPVTHEVVKMVSWEAALFNGHKWPAKFDLCGEHEHKSQTYYDNEHIARDYITGEVVEGKEDGNER